MSGDRRGPEVGVSGLALDWITGDDTGISSRALWRHMTGREQDPRDRGFGTYPHDPADFGRCHRLLVIMPEWRGRIGEMAAYGKVWAALAARWQDITDSYSDEVRGLGQDPDSRWVRGMALKTYDLMKSIIKGAS